MPITCFESSNPSILFSSLNHVSDPIIVSLILLSFNCGGSCSRREDLTSRTRSNGQSATGLRWFSEDESILPALAGISVETSFPESWDEFAEAEVAEGDQGYARAMRELGQMLLSLIQRKKQIRAMPVFNLALTTPQE